MNSGWRVVISQSNAEYEQGEWAESVVPTGMGVCYLEEGLLFAGEKDFE